MRAFVVFLSLLAVTTAHAQKPKSDEAAAQEHFQQGEMYFQTGVFDLAAKEYEAAFALFPAPALLYNVGLAHENGGDIEKALAAYKRFLDSSADDADNKEKRMEVRARVEKLERARVASAGESEKKQRALDLRARGRSEADAGKHAAAIATYREAYELGGDPEILFDIGEAYRAGGDGNAAIAAYQTYREAAPAGPRSADALRLIGELTPRRSALDGDASVSRPAKPAWKPKRFSLGALGVFGTILARGEKGSPVASGVTERPTASVYITGGWPARTWLTLGAELAIGIGEYGLEQCAPCMDVGKVHMVVPRAIALAELSPPTQWRVLPVAILGFGYAHVGGFTANNESPDIQLDESLGVIAVSAGARIRVGSGSLALLLRSENWLGNIRTAHARIDGPMQLGLMAGYIYGR